MTRYVLLIQVTTVLINIVSVSVRPGWRNLSKQVLKTVSSGALQSFEARFQNCTLVLGTHYPK